MSISEQERQALESIENGLVLSAPELASMLAMFTRLTRGPAGPPAAACRHAPAPARPVTSRPG